MGEAAIPPRAQVPVPSRRPSVAAPSRPPGDGPNLGSRSRATAPPLGPEEARRAEAARTTAVVRDRPVTREDILQRYQRADAAPRSGSQPGLSSRASTPQPSERAGADRSAAIGADRGSAASRADATTEARIANARREAAARTRAADARQDAGARDAVTRGVTRDSVDRETPAVTRPGRAVDRTATVADRVATARQDYLTAIANRGPSPTREGVGRGVTAVGAGGHNHHYHSGQPYHGYCHDGWSLHYGHTFWHNWSWSLGYGCSSWWYWAPFYTSGYWWNSYWYCGGSWHPHYRPSWYWYGPFLPWSASVIVYDDDPEVVVVQSDPEIIYVEVPAGEAAVPAEEAPAAAPLPAPAQPGALNRAADYYLSLGDRSFREGRYGDAAHYYAKALEFAPDDGILHLVLADALFATGDYRYAAYALREAFAKDPALAANIVDKRAFYSDPADFDRQLAVLERYLEDHFLDDDARLVLAANYLFGARPLDAIKLLESPFSEGLRGAQSGTLILDAARAQLR